MNAAAFVSQYEILPVMGPVDGGDSSFSPWFAAFFATFVAGMSIRHLVLTRHRRQQMTAMAVRVGLQDWPDDSIPGDLSLSGTPFESWTKLSNIYEGSIGGVQIVVFDFSKKSGKSGWSRTIVAAKTPDSDIFFGKPFDLQTSQSGDWQLLYSPAEFLNSAQLMDVGQIEETLNDIRRRTRTL
jgi:hypothetical protein